MPAEESPPPAELLLGRYRLQHRIGGGGMGEVFAARDLQLDRDVAVKRMRSAASEDAGLIERAWRETRALASCTHPGIVTILDVGDDAGRPVAVMELIDGRSLREHLDEQGRMEPVRALRLAAEVASALAHAHARQVLHRDVSPRNVMLDPDGRAVLIDFGLVRALEDSASDHSVHALLGTPAYMAPEQAFCSPDEVDARADIHGLGAVLFELLTGRPPFEGPTVLATLRRLEEEPVASTGLGAEIDALLQRALAKSPEDRFDEARTFALELERVATDMHPGIASERRAIPAEAEARPSRGRAGSLALAAILGALIGGLFVDLFGGVASPDSDASSAAQPVSASVLFGLSDTADEEVESLLAHGEIALARSLLDNHEHEPSARAQVALALCLPANLQRYLAPGLVSVDAERPDELSSDPLAAAAFELFAGAWQPAAAYLESSLARGEWSPLHGLIAIHTALVRSLDADAETRAPLAFDTTAIRLQTLQSFPPGFEEFLGLGALLAARQGGSLLLWPSAPPEDPTSEQLLTRAATAWALDDPDRATTCCEAWHDLDEDSADAACFLAWTALRAAASAGEWPEIGHLTDGAETVLDSEELGPGSPLRLLALSVAGTVALLEEDLETLDALADELISTLHARQIPHDSLPSYLETVLHACEGEELIRTLAMRDLLTEFGEDERAFEIAQRIAEDFPVPARSGLEDDEFDAATETRSLLGYNALWLASWQHDEPDEAAAQLANALELGVPVEEVLADDHFEELLDHPRLRGHPELRRRNR